VVRCESRRQGREAFERLAKPVTAGSTTIPGIKIHDTRILRLLEVLLQSGSQLAGRRTADMYRAVLEAFAITPDAYSITQLRYDVRKLRAMVSSNAKAGVAATVSQPRAFAWRPCSCCSTSASAAR
jgi:hypothetical protein